MVLVILVLFVVIWCALLIQDELQRYVHETPEMKYESSLTKKSTDALSILIPSKQFKIITTVRFRKTIETLAQSTREPKLVDTTYGHNFTKELTDSPQGYELKTKSNSVELPGMNNLISSTKRYELQQKNDEINKRVKQDNVKGSRQQLYFNHSESTVAYRDNVVAFIRLFVIVDPFVFKATNITENEIRGYLKDSVPFNFTRGDKLIIKQQSIQGSLTFLQKFYEFVAFIAIYLVSFFKKILPWLIGIILLVIGLIVFFQLQKWLKNRTKSQAIHDNDGDIAAEGMKMNEESPEYYQKKIKGLLDERSKDMARVLQRWLITNNE